MLFSEDNQQQIQINPTLLTHKMKRPCSTSSAQVSTKSRIMALQLELISQVNTEQRFSPIGLQN